MRKCNSNFLSSHENENENKMPVNMYPHKSFRKKTKTKNMTCDHELCTDHISYSVKNNFLLHIHFLLHDTIKQEKGGNEKSSLHLNSLKAIRKSNIC